MGGRSILGGLVLAACSAALAPPGHGVARAETPRAVDPGRERDAALTTKVSAQLQSADELRDTSIRVVTDGGFVRLIGVVPSEALRRVALEIARTTPGVAGVDDDLVVM